MADTTQPGSSSPVPNAGNQPNSQQPTPQVPAQPSSGQQGVSQPQPQPPVAPQPAPSVQPAQATTQAQQSVVSPAKPVPPTSGTPSGAAVPKKGPKPLKKENVIIGIVVIFLVLFVLGMILLVLMLASNPDSNPLLELLGIEPTSLRSILSGIVNGVFGFLSFIGLIFVAIGLFKIWTAPKGDAAARKKSIFMAAAALSATVVTIFIWVLLYFYISQLQVGIRVYSGIITDPAEVTQLAAPVQITFSAQGIRERYKTSKIIAYNWDFNGDGKYTEGSGEQIVHTFTDKGDNNGLFNVGVEVVFEKGKPIVVTKQVTISNILPTVAFSAAPGLKGFTPFEVSFDASESKDPDGSIVRYEWDFDDDARYDAEGVTTKHIFEDVGTHRVMLRVTDNNAATSTSEQIVTVEKTEKTEVIIDAQPGLSGTAPFEVLLDASRSVMPRTEIRSYKWSFGDGSKDERSRTATHTFAKEGSYVVALEITGADGRKESTAVSIVVSAPKAVPTAVIEVTPAPKDGVIEGDVPLTLSLSASKSTDKDDNIIEYRWSYVNPETVDESGEKVTHTYSEAGEYTVTLQAVDADDNIGTATLKVVAKEPGLIVKVSATPTSGVLPLDVVFDSSGSFVTDKDKIVAYRYDFGDGTAPVSGSAQQTHRYVKEGSFIARVTVVTNSGQEKTVDTYISVLAVPLQAKFDFRPASGEAPLEVFFDANSSTGNISTYSWDFGDGGISKVKNPEHVFDEPGTYTVKLEVQDISQNISTFTRTVIVE